MFNLNTGLLDYIFDGEIPYPALFGTLLIVLLAAYFLGSINSAILFSRLVYKDDIRKHGSGNGGMTNMLRTFGGKAALLTLLGDLSKTVISIGLAGLAFGFGYSAGMSVQPFCYLAGLFAVLGHIFPVYYRFDGGKGVLVTATMALILTPVQFLFLFCVFVAVVAMSKYVSLGSVSVAMLYPVVINASFAFLFNSKSDGIIVLTSIILAIIITFCHIENLKRIGERTENKISFKKKNKND